MGTTAAMIQHWLAARAQRTDEERGASLVEYALLVALIALICFVAVGFLGESTGSNLEGFGSSLANERSN